MILRFFHNTLDCFISSSNFFASFLFSRDGHMGGKGRGSLDVTLVLRV